VARAPDGQDLIFGPVVGPEPDRFGHPRPDLVARSHPAERGLVANVDALSSLTSTERPPVVGRYSHRQSARYGLIEACRTGASKGEIPKLVTQ
jgi:hypothetical protein